MSDADLARKVAVLETLVAKNDEHVSDQKAAITKLEAKVEAMKQEATDRERNAMRAGIAFLGTAVLALIGVVWSYRSLIVGGSPG